MASMKNRTALWVDVITAKVLKAGDDPMVAMLHKIFNTIYDTEKTPKDWAQMIVTPIHKNGDKQMPVGKDGTDKASLKKRKPFLQNCLFHVVVIHISTVFLNSFLKKSPCAFHFLHE